MHYKYLDFYYQGEIAFIETHSISGYQFIIEYLQVVDTIMRQHDRTRPLLVLSHNAKTPINLHLIRQVPRIAKRIPPDVRGRVAIIRGNHSAAESLERLILRQIAESQLEFNFLLDTQAGIDWLQALH